MNSNTGKTYTLWKKVAILEQDEAQFSEATRQKQRVERETVKEELVSFLLLKLLWAARSRIIVLVRSSQTNFLLAITAFLPFSVSVFSFFSFGIQRIVC